MNDEIDSPKDPWGQDPEISMDDLAIWGDYQQWSQTPRGERILEHLRQNLYVRETMTPEEAMTQAGQPTPIDTTALLLRSGMRRAFMFIEAQCTALEDLERMRDGKPGGRTAR